MPFKKLIVGLLLASGCVALAQAPDSGKEPIRGVTIAPHPLKEFVPVTPAVLKKPDANDWLMMRGNYEGYGFSTLDQINTANVKGLQLVWSRTMEPGINEATPIIYKGVMFLGSPNDVIQAIDAATGDLLWQYRRNLRSEEHTSELQSH